MTPVPDPGTTLAESARRLRRAARTIPGPDERMLVVLPHADWIDFCSALDELPRGEHNRERGAYFGSLIRRSNPRAVVVVTIEETTHGHQDPTTED